MMEKLTARAAGSVPVAVKEPLKWTKPVITGPHNTGYILSECGKFSIVKSSHELGYVYGAWDLRTKTHENPATLLGCVGSREAAVALCEAVA